MNGLKTTLLLASLAALFIFIGGMWGGQTGIVIAFVLAAGMNAVSYWFSDRIVLKMHSAKQVGEESVLYRVTRRLAQKANLPMPKVYVIPQESPNAFATGRNPDHAAVAATEGLLRILSESELEGVIAHELSHVKHRDILISSIAATLAAAILAIVRMAQFASFFGVGSGRNDGRGQNPIALIATIILAPIAAMLIQAAVSRSREFDADRGGADMVGTPSGLVSALRKIDAGAKQIPLETNPAAAHMFIIKPFLGGLGNLFSTHPPTEERIKRLIG
jgi:heat shock protein HtpX